MKKEKNTPRDAFASSIKEIEEKIGYTFEDKSLLTQAFTRTSFCNERKSRTGAPMQSNEVLEFFGDSVLSTAIVTIFLGELSKRYEYGIYTELCEGDLSNLRSKLSDKKNLSNATRGMGIQRYLRMGEGDMKLGIENEPSVMEDLFESIVGAIYIDSGYDLPAVIASVSRMLDIKAYFTNGTGAIQSHKNALQEWCADKKHRRAAPVYKTVSEDGPDHKKMYTRACFIGDVIYGRGTAKNQKLADALAAEEALAALIAEEEGKPTAHAKKDAPTEAAITRLKEYAAREKKTSPEFRDLGESMRSTEAQREYQIECRFMGMSTVGCAGSKKDARIAAAAMMLDTVTADKKLQKTKTPKARPAKMPTVSKKTKPSHEKASTKSPSPDDKKTKAVSRERDVSPRKERASAKQRRTKRK